MMGTDRDWEKWGAQDPYYGVLSADQYRLHNLSAQSREAFFSSGEEQTRMVFDTIRRAFDTELCPARTLDFGCGVGRLLIPLARNSGHVIGMDVSPSMLAEAQRNCSRYQVSNCDVVLSDDSLSRVDGSFELVHASLVLPHIPPGRGRHIVQELLRRVNPGGFAVLQIFYRCNAPAVVRAAVRLRYAFPPVNWARNLYRRRPVFEPPMQLHVYELPHMLPCMRQLGFRHIHQVLDSVSNGQFESTFLFAQRSGNTS